MAIQVLMPKIGLTMTEGKIVEWKKREGEWVEKGEIIFVFETEKVTFDVEAPDSGFLIKILVKEDGVVPVGEVVGLLSMDKDEQVGVADAKAATSPQAVQESPAQAEPIRPGNAEATTRIRATPLAKKLAKQRGIDLRMISGSGVSGRIKARDVISAPEIQPVEPVSAPVEEGRLVKLSGMRKIIAQKMLASKVETAQTYMTVSVDATNIMESRQKLIPLVQKRVGVRLTITDILMKITASAIALHPIINTR